MLFHEKRLSSDRRVSCASCHRPELGFTNGQAVGVGVGGQLGDRNVPTLLNRHGTGAQFWDMRAPTLESQAVEVISNPSEMGGDPEGAVKRLRADSRYRRAFREVYGATPDMDHVARALAAYERTLRSTESPYDRYVRGDLQALNEDQLRGKELFFNKFKCAACHKGDNFSDEKLNVRCYPFTAGLTGVPTQRFKTPTLRNLKFTGPYMHNGALKTLEEAVDFYSPSLHLNADGKPSGESRPIHVTEQEKRDLVAFLRSLSGSTAYVESE